MIMCPMTSVNHPVKDEIESPKDMLARWENEAEFKELSFKLSLWAALEQQGFSGIRLECFQYESVHGVWRFAFSLGSVARNSAAVETRICNACAQVGYPIKKHFVSARIEGRRAVGGIVLKPTKRKAV